LSKFGKNGGVLLSGFERQFSRKFIYDRFTLGRFQRVFIETIDGFIVGTL
jgi:hypothetical protein